MQNTFKRSLALLLCLTLLLSLLTGCGKKSDVSTETTVEPVKTQYDADTSFTFDYEEKEIQRYDQEVIYSIDFDGETVQTDAGLPDPQLSGKLDGALPSAPETFTPVPAGEETQSAEASDAFGDIELQEGISLLPQLSIAPQSAQGSVSMDIEAAPLASYTAPKQLTIEDIQAMNPDSVVIDIYKNNGYLSTLVGKYYDKPVRDMEDGVLSIQGMASLLGLGKGCEFFAVYSETNDKGYTFYTYQQRYGDYTLRYATLRIVVDPNGYTAGLTCSFVPNIGTASQEPAITKEQAEQIVREKFARFNLTYYPEHTVRLAVTLNYNVYNCYVVYSNNPDATAADATASFDMPYIEHFVCTDGNYLTLIPANNFATDNANVIDNSGYFQGLEVKNYTRTIKLADGTRRDIDVPVSYNSRDGKYYLMDPSRMIAVAQFYDLNYKGTVNLVRSDTIDGWSDNNLMAYANYIILYDFYADHGIRSIDGFGIPILVTVGWCEEDGTPVNNACFYGVNQGWACFGVSDVNHSSDCVDVVGHEFTHGVTNLSMQGSIYQNETGAINEAYSDIMGNLAEMSLGYTSDTSWLIAEHRGSISRSMSDPNKYEQPAFVGDVYYWPSTRNPDFDVNDLGGVHVNNSLLGHIAYRMGQTGMSYEQQIGMWLNSIELLTPRSDYEDLHGALLFSLKINGLLSSYGGALNQAFADAGLNDDWSKSYLKATKSGCGRVFFETGEDGANALTKIFFQSQSGSKPVYCGFPDDNGTVSVLLPEGRYITQISVFRDNQRLNYNYTGSGWVQNGNYYVYTVKAGETLELIGTDGQKSGQPAPDEKKELKLFNYNGGYFSMLVPDGWRMEQNGEYGAWSIKIFDPEDPSTQMFFYSALGPYHKSVNSRAYWKKYDTMIGNGPVLPVANILGILATWDYAIEYQSYYEKQYFTSLHDIKVVDGGFFNGPYASVGGIESGCFATCRTNYDDDCKLTIVSSLVDNDIYNSFGGNMFYMSYGLCGILAPADRYDEVLDALRQCLESIQFTSSYIRASQSSSNPMADQSTITQNLAIYSAVIKVIYDTFGR